jgi:YD repeat-containing protein
MNTSTHIAARARGRRRALWTAALGAVILLPVALFAGPPAAPSHPGATSAVAYEYDAQGRLTRVTYDGELEFAYAYDAAGNVRHVEVGRARR